MDPPGTTRDAAASRPERIERVLAERVQAADYVKWECVSRRGLPATRRAESRGLQRYPELGRG